MRVILIAAISLVAALLVVFTPRSVTITSEAPPTCKCPPPLTPEQEEAQEKYERCVQMKRAFEARFGTGPYEWDCDKYLKPTP
jgi:hypothetical protein